MKKILLIGGCGYIGTALHAYLSRQETAEGKRNLNAVSDENRFVRIWRPTYDIDIVDLLWFGNHTGTDVQPRDYRTLTREELARYDVVILLAAFSSPAMSINSGVLATHRENYDNFVGLVSKLLPGQKFIFMSTASLYHGIPTEAQEDFPLFDAMNSYDITKRQCDELMRLFPDVEYYSLRLGTVSGPSDNLRIDTAINSMATAALRGGIVEVYNGDVCRAFLDIDELCRAVHRIIDERDDKRGIYNLASFNATMNEVAERVASALDAKLSRVSQEEIERRTGAKLPPKTYDFAMDSSKFRETFNLPLRGDPELAAKKLRFREPNIKNRSKRVDGVKYE